VRNYGFEEESDFCIKHLEKRADEILQDRKK